MATIETLERWEQRIGLDVNEVITGQIPLDTWFTTREAALVAWRAVPRLQTMRDKLIMEYIRFHLSKYEDIERKGNYWRW